MAAQPLLKSRDVARMLGATETSVRRWANHGATVNGIVVVLSCVHAGAEYRFTEEAVRKFSEDCGRAKRGEPPIAFDATDGAKAQAAFTAKYGSSRK